MEEEIKDTSKRLVDFNVLDKLMSEIEEYDNIIKDIDTDLDETDNYEIELRDRLRGRLVSSKRARTDAIKVYQETSDSAKQSDGLTDFRRMMAYVNSIETPYTREDYERDVKNDVK